MECEQTVIRVDRLPRIESVLCVGVQSLGSTAALSVEWMEGVGLFEEEAAFIRDTLAVAPDGDLRQLLALVRSAAA